MPSYNGKKRGSNITEIEFNNVKEALKFEKKR